MEAIAANLVDDGVETVALYDEEELDDAEFHNIVLRLLRLCRGFCIVARLEISTKLCFRIITL